MPKCVFKKITLRRGCSPVNLLHIYKTIRTVRVIVHTIACILLSHYNKNYNTNMN